MVLALYLLIPKRPWHTQCISGTPKFSGFLGPPLCKTLAQARDDTQDFDTLLGG